jgi:hypothetical protein
MRTPTVSTRPSSQLSLKDRLSRLTFIDACKILGPQGAQLIQQGANQWDIKIEEHVLLGDDLFRLRLPERTEDGQPLVVTITLMAEARQRLHWNCTHCIQACEHVGAAFSLILEDKTALGLAAPPRPRVAVESLDEDALVARALAERAERAKVEKMAIRTADATKPWTDYTVTNRTSGKSYRVALRGLEPGVPAALVDNLRAGLHSCVERGTDGKPRLTVTLPDEGALEGLAQTLARLLALSQPENGASR